MEPHGVDVGAVLDRFDGSGKFVVCGRKSAVAQSSEWHGQGTGHGKGDGERDRKGGGDDSRVPDGYRARARRQPVQRRRDLLDCMVVHLLVRSECRQHRPLEFRLGVSIGHHPGELLLPEGQVAEQLVDSSVVERRSPKKSEGRFLDMHGSLCSDECGLRVGDEKPQRVRLIEERPLSCPCIEHVGSGGQHLGVLGEVEHRAKHPFASAQKIDREPFEFFRGDAATVCGFVECASVVDESRDAPGNRSSEDFRIGMEFEVPGRLGDLLLIGDGG